jgi:NADH-quinone oxidoreductase subunit J
MLGLVYFVLFAVVCVASAVALWLSRHPLNGAMALVVNMLSLGGLYAVLQSPFMGVVQVLVYAGAVMTLIVFVVMVLNGAREYRLPRMDALGLVAAALALGLGLMVAGAVVYSGAALAPSELAVKGTVARTAARLFDTSAGGPGYFILFEVTGLVLLSAMAGAVLLAKKKL